jgi:sugar phosphate permease
MTSSTYHGWRIAWALALTQTVGYGVLYYAFGVLIKPMEAELGWTRAQTSMAFSLALLVEGIVAIGVGRWVDRHGARGLMTFGSLLGSLLMFAWSFIHDLWAFYLLWIGIGFASSLVLYPVAFTVLAVWFQKQRSRAMLIVTLAAGLASTIFIPLCTWLIGQVGWREALPILALILAIATVPAHALVIRRRPQDLGLTADGETLEAGTKQASRSSITHRDALKTATFWWLTLAFSLSSLTALAAAAHLVALLTERGHASALVAVIAGSVGAWQLAGRIVYTPLSERLSLFGLSAIFSALHGVGILALLILPGTLGPWAFAASFGLANGSMSLAKAALIADVYGSSSYGSISGNLTTFTAITSMIAPLGVGLLHDATGNYDLALRFLVIASSISALAIWRAGQHPIVPVETLERN